MSGRAYGFVQVDVFTDRIFGGNALAVVPEAQGLRDDEMQAVAREMNLSETTFVLPSSHPDCRARVRIFAPARELPFAGHPTVGTAWVLATQGRLPPGTKQFSLEEGIGPVAVELEGRSDRPSFVWMRHPDATFEPEITDRTGLARALGLTDADLLAGAPIETGSTGLAFVFVPLRDRATVDRAVLDVTALLRTLGQGAPAVFVFTPDPDPGAGRVYSRMFSPHRGGIAEDPATGSASGPLGAYLVRHALVKRADEIVIVSEQGTAMGRQSFIHIRLRCREERVEAIRVGGRVVPVLEGVLHLP